MENLNKDYLIEKAKSIALNTALKKSKENINLLTDQFFIQTLIDIITDDEFTEELEEIIQEEIKNYYSDVVNDLQSIMDNFELFDENVLDDIYFYANGVKINDNYGNDIYSPSIEDFAEWFTSVSQKDNKETVVNLLEGRITLEDDNIDYIENCRNGEKTEANCSSDDFDDYKQAVEDYNNNVYPYIEEVIKELHAYYLDLMLASGSGKKQSRGKI